VIVSPVDLRRIVETSALLKSGKPIVDVVKMRINKRSISVYQRTPEMILVNDYRLDRFDGEDLEGREIAIRSEEFIKLLKSNFSVDEHITVSVKDSKLVLEGSRDKVEVMLASESVAEFKPEKFEKFGDAEFVVSEKYRPRYYVKLDVAYLKELDYDEWLELWVEGEKFYAGYESTTYSVVKNIPLINVGGELPESSEKFRFAKKVAESLFSILEGNITIAFAGYNDRGEPMPVSFSQREDVRNFRLLYVVMPLLR